MNENTETTIEQAAEQTEERTYTLEEVQKMIDSEADRRTTKALKKQEDKFNKERSLFDLDEQQREKARAQMQIDELTAQLAAVKVEKNKAEITKVLAGRGLPVVFADMISIGEDIEEAQKRIDDFDIAFKAAVSEEVKKRLASTNPVAGTGSTATDMKHMSLAERQRLYETNPTLYNRLTK